MLKICRIIQVVPYFGFLARDANTIHVNFQVFLTGSVTITTEGPISRLIKRLFVATTGVHYIIWDASK
jgi:hypothetical protein